MLHQTHSTLHQQDTCISILSHKNVIDAFNCSFNLDQTNDNTIPYKYKYVYKSLILSVRIWNVCYNMRRKVSITSITLDFKETLSEQSLQSRSKR